MSEANVDDQILNLILNDHGCLRTFIESPIDASHFDREKSTLVLAILDAEAKGSQLTENGYDLFMQKNSLSKKERIAKKNEYFRLANTIDASPQDLPSLLERKRVEYVDSVTIRSINKFREQRDSDPVAAAVSLADEIRFAATSASQDKRAEMFITKDAEFRSSWRSDLMERRVKEEEALCCGMPEFDDIMATGFDQMTLTVIVGDTGSFKTTTMMNIACGVCEKNNVDVLYVPLEMTAHQMYNKLVSRGANIPLNVLLKPKTYLTEDHINKIDKFEKEEEDREGRFALLDIGERTTVSAIRRQIEQSIHIVQPRLVVIDYVANLLPDRSHNGRHDLEIGDMLKDMLKMGKAGVVTEKGFGVVTAAQLGREALKRLKNQKDSSKMTLGSDDIQNSHQYSTDASAIFGLYRPSQDADKTLMVIPMKSRFGPKTYENTSNPNCALLTVQPEYSRVMTSQELDWSSNAEEILMKSSTPPKALQSQNNLDDWDFDEESGSAITVSANPVESEELQDLLS